MVGGVAVAAAVRSWPFRVFSFPSEIIIPSIEPFYEMNKWYSPEALEALKEHFKFTQAGMRIFSSRMA
jgi:hypothetical protein